MQSEKTMATSDIQCCNSCNTERGLLQKPVIPQSVHSLVGDTLHASRPTLLRTQVKKTTRPYRRRWLGKGHGGQDSIVPSIYSTCLFSMESFIMFMILTTSLRTTLSNKTHGPFCESDTRTQRGT
ncbi:hypothetical protein C0J52_14242 [Blattella germanica]|nr:hypothetical protein C0J52_14242 [Blattella germanica]